MIRRIAEKGRPRTYMYLGVVWCGFEEWSMLSTHLYLCTRRWTPDVCGECRASNGILGANCGHSDALSSTLHEKDTRTSALAACEWLCTGSQPDSGHNVGVMLPHRSLVTPIITHAASSLSLEGPGQAVGHRRYWEIWRCLRTLPDFLANLEAFG